MSKKTYTLSDRPQLIDLNGSHVNFLLDFQVRSVQGKQSFETIVLTQDQLDTTDLEKIEMKVANGQIGGTITANNNKYQNYFLLLKQVKEETVEKTDPIEVEVVLNLKPLEVSVSESKSEINPEGMVHQRQSEYQGGCEPGIENIPFYQKPIFWIGLLCLSLLLGYYYLFVIRKKDSVGIEKLSDPSLAPATTPEMDSPVVSPPTHSLSEDAKLYNRVSTLAQSSVLK